MVGCQKVVLALSLLVYLVLPAQGRLYGLSHHHDEVLFRSRDIKVSYWDMNPAQVTMVHFAGAVAPIGLLVLCIWGTCKLCKRCSCKCCECCECCENVETIDEEDVEAGLESIHYATPSINITAAPSFGPVSSLNPVDLNSGVSYGVGSGVSSGVSLGPVTGYGVRDSETATDTDTESCSEFGSDEESVDYNEVETDSESDTESVDLS